MVREMEKCMGKNEIVGYEPLVDDLKDLIHKKQYQVLKSINSETVNLYWEIGEEIYRQQEENDWGKSIVQVLSTELQKEFPSKSRSSILSPSLLSQKITYQCR